MTILTKETKDRIDSMPYRDLLREWRYAPVGHPDFKGEVGEYWASRMKFLRDQDGSMHVAASKSLGWD